MARTSVTSQALPYAGLTPVHAAAAVAGEVVDCGRTFLSVINGGGSSITVTVSVPNKVDGDLTVGPRVVTVPTGTTPTLIPLNSTNYKQPTTAGTDAGRAYVDYSAVTSVTRAVVSFS